MEKISNLKWKDKLLKFLFDSKCSVCGREVEEDKIYLCKKCEKELFEEKSIHKRKNIYFLYFYGGIIKKLIAAYKFREIKDISKIIGKLIEKELKEIIIKNKIQVIVPAPANKERIRTRGFNQVEVVLDEIGLKYTKIERRKDTLPMHKLYNRNLRKLNVRAAFYSEVSFENKRVLIVDDIITTGSTIKGIMKALEQKGAPKEVFIFSICASRNFKTTDFWSQSKL